mgnify:CR=1 FL=1
MSPEDYNKVVQRGRDLFVKKKDPIKASTSISKTGVNRFLMSYVAIVFKFLHVCSGLIFVVEVAVSYFFCHGCVEVI